MFDRTIIQRGSDRLVPYEKEVNHKYATTTEQAKYLDELKREALSSVKEVIRVECLSGLDFSVARVHFSPDSLSTKYVACVKVNGQEIFLEPKLKPFSTSIEEIIDDLVESLSKEIAMKIIGCTDQITMRTLFEDKS